MPFGDVAVDTDDAAHMMYVDCCCDIDYLQCRIILQGGYVRMLKKEPSPSTLRV